MRPPTKLRNRLKNLDANSADYKVLELSLKKADACCALQCDKVKLLSPLDMAPLDQALHTLEINNMQIPVANPREVTAKHVIRTTPNGNDVCSWAKYVWLWPGSEERWPSSNVVLSACGPRDENDFRDMSKTWYSAIVHDTFLTALTAAGESQDAGTLLRYVDSFLTEAMAHPPPEEIINLVDPIAKTMRGVVALISPQPGLHGSSIRDVNYVCPEGKTSPLTRELPRYGLIIFNRVKSSKLWLPRMGRVP